MTEKPCSGIGFPCIGDNDNPICQRCTSNTSNENYDMKNSENLEERLFLRNLRRLKDE